MKRIAFIMVAVGFVLGSAGLVFANGQPQKGTGSATSSSPTTHYTYYMITHACPSVNFWKPVFNGANIVAKKLGVKLHNVLLTSAQCGSIPAEVSNFETAVSAHPDGILLTVTSDTAFSSALQQAKKDGIPVVAINTVPTNNNPKVNPYLAYVGQDNYQAGLGAGKEAINLFGLTSGNTVGVIDHEPFNISLTAREKGIAAALKPHGVKVIDVNTSDNPSTGANVVGAFIQHNPNVNAILTLAPIGTTEVVQAMKNTNTTGKIDIGGFDLDSAVLHYIEDGTVGFTVDQQPFLQGAYGVIELYMQSRFGAQPENFSTGPAYLTKQNVSRLSKLVDLTGF